MPSLNGSLRVGPPNHCGGACTRSLVLILRAMEGPLCGSISSWLTMNSKPLAAWLTVPWSLPVLLQQALNHVTVQHAHIVTFIHSQLWRAIEHSYARTGTVRKLAGVSNPCVQHRKQPQSGGRWLYQYQQLWLWPIVAYLILQGPRKLTRRISRCTKACCATSKRTADKKATA